MTDKQQQIGELQLSFLLEHGLEPNHRLLDLGFGRLRGGQHLIRYLDRSMYFGLEKYDEWFLESERLVESDETLHEKDPCLTRHNILLSAGETFECIRFDVGLAFSVFTHMLPWQISIVLLRYVPQCKRLFATYNPGLRIKAGKAHPVRAGEMDRVSYPFETLSALASDVGVRAVDIGDFGHPNGQFMAMFT